MNVIANVLVAFVALIHVYILILEMFFWTKPKGLKVFRHSLVNAKSSAVLAANQGLYNGFLAAGLVWSLFQPVVEFSFQLKIFFLSCVIVAGVYGGITAVKKIIYVQAMPALFALICVLIS